MCANIKIPYYYYMRQYVLEIGREIGRKREILKREREREREIVSRERETNTKERKRERERENVLQNWSLRGFEVASSSSIWMD